MRIKKIISEVLAVTMAMSLMTGCGAESSDSKGSSDITGAKTTAGSDTKNKDNASGTKTTSGNGKTLVVYYSATGSTKLQGQLQIPQVEICLRFSRKILIQMMIWTGRMITAG